MSSTEALGRGQSFEGLLFEGNARDKSWSLVCEDSITMTISPPGGRTSGGGWNMVATQSGEKVWECGIGIRLKHRVKDNFLQWQHKTSEGSLATSGLQLKTAELAQQFNAALATAVSASAVKTKKAPSDSVLLQIIPPTGEPLSLPLPPATTITQVMAMVAEKRKLNPAHYNLALPPEDPKGEGVACFGSMSVSRLKTHTLYLRRQEGAPEEPRLNNTDKAGDLVVQVELPRGERTTLRASSFTPLPELLQIVCKKRMLNVEEFRFDLPATEDSLAGKTLGQLRINSLKLVPRAENGEDVKGKKQKLPDVHLTAESPKGGTRRQAPPPPPSKVAVNLMKELSAEVTERLRDRGEREGEGEGEGGGRGGGGGERERRRTSPLLPPVSVATPTARPTDAASGEQDQKPIPPPKALKPKRKPVVEEVDEGRRSPSIPRSTLDSLVMGVKVREAAERPEMGSITEGLRLTAASGGRYMPIKKRQQLSVEEPARSSQLQGRGDYRKSREMEDIGTLTLSPSSFPSNHTQSLRRRPRGPAPAPPRPSQHAATLGRRPLQVPKDKKAEGGSVVRRPVRKAPAPPRPNPEQTKAKATPTKKALVTVASPEEALQQQIDALQQQKEAIQQQRLAEEATQQEEVEEIDFSGYEFYPLTPPKMQSPPPPPLPTSSPSPPFTTPLPPSTSSPLPPSNPSPLPPSTPSPIPPSTPSPLPTSTPSTPQPSTPSPPSHSHRSTPTTPHSRLTTTTHIEDKEDGGKRLIIKPSPNSARKTNIIFNLPPPPPPPQFTVAEEDGDGDRNSDDDAVNVPSSEAKDGSKSPVDTVPPPIPCMADSHLTPSPVSQPSFLSTPNEQSILSNEYTNLDDDSDNEVTTDFTDAEVVEGDSGRNMASPDGSGVSLEHIATTTIEEVSYETSLLEDTGHVVGDSGLSDGDGSTGDGDGATGDGDGATGDSASSDGVSSASSVQEYDIHLHVGVEERKCDSGLKGDMGKREDNILPPPVDEHVNLALNCNGNNNMDVSTFPPPPLEFVTPSEIFSAPTPQRDLEMPSEPVFDEGNSELVAHEDKGTESGAVVLVGMTTHCEEVPAAVADVDGGSGGVVMRGSESSSSVKSLRTQLSELDSMVTSIQDMAEDMATECSLPSPPSPSSPSPPPPPIASPPPISKSPLPPKPPPPPVPVSTKQSRPSPKPANPVTVSPAGNAYAELGKTLAARRQYQRQPAPSPTIAPTHIPSHTLVPTDTQQSVEYIPPTSQAIGPHPAPLPGTLPGGGADMQFQLQMLQQQMLQQQMMQLQQQFSQLQRSMHPLPLPHPLPHPLPLPVVTPSIYPQHHPAMVAMPTAGITGGSIAMPMAIPGGPVAMPMAGIPSVGPSVAIPTTEVVHASDSGLPTTMGHKPATPPTCTPPPSSTHTLPPSPPDPAPMTSTPTAPEKPRPPSTSDLRAGALGQLEPQFDRLMENVRETDRTGLLRKLSSEEGERGTEGGSYTGMAAVLADALKERRKYFADKHNRSLSEMEDSKLSDWDT